MPAPMVTPMRWLSLLAVLLYTALAPAQSDDKFQVSASFEPAAAKPGDVVTLRIEATVADGWHAYGTKETNNIPVALPAAKLQLGGLEIVAPAKIPEGTPKPGPLGPQYELPPIFTVDQQLRVPAGMAAGEVKVAGQLKYQICDENSCLPPDHAKFTATLQVEAAPAGAAATQDPAAGLGVKPGLQLDPDAKLTLTARFEPATARAGETVQLVLEAVVIEGWHAYGTRETTNEPVRLLPEKLKLGALERVGEPQVPPGDYKDFAGLETYPLPPVFEVRQAVAVPVGTPPGEIAVEGALDYTVCDENSCDPAAEAPFRAKLVVEAGEARAGATVPLPVPPVETPVEPPVEPPTTAAPDASGFGGSLWALILACIGGGLFALAMPCTYPMIPITFSFFTKQAEKRGGNVLSLAIVYGLGIVAMFTIVGALMAQVIIDVVNHWVTNVVIGAMFVFFAFVLFGWINLSPPQSLQRAAGKASAVGGYLGVFFMGATLVITSFTCTAPIVGSLLANVAQFGTGRVALGMAIFGLTMAAPFVFLSLMPTKVKQMPKSGEWMETLKVSLGFVELAAALKFVSMVDFALGWQIMPRELFLLLWTAIFGMWALYLFGILRKAGSPNEGVGAGRMASGMAVTLLATYFLFGALGNKLDSIMTGFIPGYSNSLVSRGESGESKPKAGHTLVYDDPAEATRVAIAEDKLLLYNFTGFN